MEWKVGDKFAIKNHWIRDWTGYILSENAKKYILWITPTSGEIKSVQFEVHKQEFKLKATRLTPLEEAML